MLKIKKNKYSVTPILISVFFFKFYKSNFRKKCPLLDGVEDKTLDTTRPC